MKEEPNQENERISSSLTRIGKLASDPLILERLIRSIAPKILGNINIKEAILYLLLGGVTKSYDGESPRGNIHVLLVGDPGTGISQLLRFAAKVAPNGTYITGKGSNASGMTPSQLWNKNGSTKLIPGALIHADQGVLAIDNLEKMEEEDKDVLESALEQQVVEVNQDGVITTMNARTSVLAAANPVLGTYNQRQAIPNNTNLNVPLIICFDLIFILRDLPDITRDSLTADKILNANYPPIIPFETLIDLPLLRSYISHAKSISPMLTKDAISYLKKFYVGMRNGSREEMEMLPGAITARQLETLVRLAEARARAHLRKKVLLEDAEAAVTIMKRNLEPIVIEICISKEFDFDVFYPGRNRRVLEKLQRVLGVISEMERITGMVRNDDLIDALIRDHNIGRSEAARLIELLEKDMVIYSPKPGYIKKGDEFL